MPDLGNGPGIFPVEIKQRRYDGQGQFLGNYKAGLCKEGDLRKVIGGDLEERWVSRPFSESEIMKKYPEVLLNSLGVEIKGTHPARC